MFLHYLWRLQARSLLNRKGLKVGTVSCLVALLDLGLVGVVGVGTSAILSHPNKYKYKLY